MVEDQPVRGVGTGNFHVTSIHYLLESPGAIKYDEFIVDKPKVAHNTYLQVLAELGIVGLTLFLAIIGFAVACALKAARWFGRRATAIWSCLARPGGRAHRPPGGRLLHLRAVRQAAVAAARPRPGAAGRRAPHVPGRRLPRSVSR